ncbi:3,4-dioxygenase subunit beta [Actinorhabdospora filicis]|uniref:3,4-dioxygenase subunit beta n=1 Tax=Actinorhabdospora filicis TaxID=1785913 RepID=A0A9W6SSR3_9ACTN|nr:intradiol ring-cleavage dioxygenase [Actinorhabdospora filicis]GLZ81627.1 3,4-dioxygenase subunit beta [Actinorhabdospora filicis]
MTEIEDHDRGLDFDLRTLTSRRLVLGLFGAAGAGALAACAAPKAAEPKASAPGPATGTATDVGEIPEETAGPYPGDGSNGPNALTESGIVRSDIRSSFGTASGTAEGVPAVVTLNIVDAGTATPLKGAAVYIWHCDRDGNYSMYSAAAKDQNYLRGVQEADAGGTVTFTTIFPACYDGRWPHMHFEVYADLAAATSAGDKLKTSQLALPKAACDEVYATGGYEKSTRTFARVSLDSDMVFRDGSDKQLAAITGDPSAGYHVSLDVGV